MQSKLPKSTFIDGKLWIEVEKKSDAYVARLFEKGYEHDWLSATRASKSDAIAACTPPNMKEIDVFLLL